MKWEKKKASEEEEVRRKVPEEEVRRKVPEAEVRIWLKAHMKRQKVE